VNVLAGPFAIVCLLLALGGAQKALRPADTARALRALRIPAGERIVRLGGAVELAIAALALGTGAPVLAALVAASYAAFAAFVVIALRAGAPIRSCGCFGKADTPPHPVHVVLDVAAAGVAAVATLANRVALPSVVAHQPLAGVPFVGLVLVGVYLAFVSLSVLPVTLAAARSVRT
jgi:hypothetical protein